MPKTLSKKISQVFIQYLSNKSRSTTRVLVSEKKEPGQNSFEIFFGIFEIHIPYKASSKLIQDVFSKIEQSFYSAKESGLPIQESLEEALTQGNILFNEIIELEKSNFGNLSISTILEKTNAIIGLTHEDSLYLSTKNNIGAFLVRKTNQIYKMSSISQGNEDIDNNLLFSSTLEGQIEPGDYLFFANNDLLNFISKERITKTITTLEPQRSADYFKNALIVHDGFNFAALIINLPFNQNNQSESQASTSINKLNLKENATEKILSPNLIPNISFNFLDKIKKQFQKIKNTNTKVSIPSIITKKPELKLPEFTKITKDFNNISNKFKESRIAQSFVINIKKLWTSLIFKVNNIPQLSKVLLALFLISAGLFSYSIYFNKPHAFDFILGPKISEEFTNIEIILNEAESKLIYGDKETAKSLIIDAETKLTAQKISSSEEQQFATSLQLKLTNLVAKIRQITVINEPTVLYTAPTTSPSSILDGLAKSGDMLYVANSNNNTITSINTREKSNSLLNGTTSSPIVQFHEYDGNILAVSKDNKFYKISDSSIKNISVSLQSSDLVSDFTYYNDRLYNLVPSKNQIFRHAKEGENYGSAVTWIQESGIDISKAIGVGIDTRVWVALSDGGIVKFFKGLKQAFATSAIDPELKNINKFQKRESQKYLYILDSKENRIIVLDDTGALITQYFSEKLNNITSFYADEENKTIYLTNGDSVYSFFTNH